MVMRSEILEGVSVDLLSVPPLIFRGIRRRLLRPTLADVDVEIRPHHFEIMALLKEEGTLYVAEIGERLLIAKAQMTQLIDKLVDLGIVERTTDATDRRTINITLTDKGRVFLEEHQSIMMNAVRETMSCLTDEELRDLSDSLRKLRDILAKLQ
jgi:DNA-binding MarR family transcriptional regulator